MWRVFWTTAAVIGTILASVFWASANSTFLYKHPKSKETRIVIDQETGAAVVEGYADTSKNKTVKAAAMPRVAAPTLVHDFGVMNPLTMGTHAFVLKNTGAAPLQLAVGPTTCKCTMSGLGKQSLEPGEQTTVTLEWNTGRDSVYEHSGTIYTNDPLKKSLEFRVKGRVRTIVGADVDALQFGSLEPGKTATLETVIYTQMWNKFEIEEVESRLENLKWEVLPLDSSELAALDATAAQKLRVTLPDDLPVGTVSDSLRIRLKVGDDDSRHHHDLPIEAKVAGAYVVYGSAIDESGMIDLGVHPQRKGHTEKLVIKIRDRDRHLKDPKIEVSPSFLKVALTPLDPDDATKGLYNLSVELPADAPPGQYRSNPLGDIRIDTGHPRVGIIKLKASFAVMPRERL